MNGMNKETGQLLKGHAHLKQSITDILTTPLGSRVMRRDYGSRLFELVDAPSNEANITEFYAATAEAIEQWEPRLKLLNISVTNAENGHITIDLVGEYLPDGEVIKLEGLVV
ncbi:GPW/gp25 family protein [Paraneptunicella aestuarii]|uniref:GPW/gp25 family protein n=1 Tax=Paraneptunicella aestuarii TaxID=2831148 RepID=UPI001E5BE111|nr:GPW/gp25 family protein [Paraneptunicella aestuarii]UAA38214.1 GPW/gp25 family protein [Paraneptunicella aestuarii]